MLDMRPDCETCGCDLPPDSNTAHICSFECTFCSECCGRGKLPCPNCGGVLTSRPTRTGAALEKFPASEQRRFAQ